MKELQTELEYSEEETGHSEEEANESNGRDLEWEVINDKLLLISSAANIRRKEIQSTFKSGIHDENDKLGVIDLKETKELINNTMDKDPRGIEARNKHIHSLEKWNDTGMWEEIIKEGEEA